MVLGAKSATSTRAVPAPPQRARRGGVRGGSPPGACCTEPHGPSAALELGVCRRRWESRADGTCVDLGRDGGSEEEPRRLGGGAAARRWVLTKQGWSVKEVCRSTARVMYTHAVTPGSTTVQAHTTCFCGRQRNAHAPLTGFVSRVAHRSVPKDVLGLSRSRCQCYHRQESKPRHQFRGDEPECGCRTRISYTNDRG